MFKMNRVTAFMMSALVIGSAVCTPAMAAETTGIEIEAVSAQEELPDAAQEDSAGKESSSDQEAAAQGKPLSSEDKATVDEPGAMQGKTNEEDQPEAETGKEGKTRDNSDNGNTDEQETKAQNEGGLPLTVAEGTVDVSQKDAYNAPAAWDAEKLASLPVLETDVAKASDGCILLGLPGEYIAAQQAVLDRINEIREEACEEGVINPETNKPLTPDDYVPLKWSHELEKVARIRAAESSMTGYHERTNGGSWQSVKSELTYVGECIAWNYSSSATAGIEQWYGEKKYWLEGNAEDSGHYTTLIRPAMRSVGAGTFYSSYTEYPNTTSLEFSTEAGADQSFVNTKGECVQKLEVLEARLSGSPSIIGTLSGVKGDAHQLLLTAGAVYNGPVFTANTKSLLFKEGVDWSSLDSGIAAVSEAGVVKAGKCGKASITAKAENGAAATASFAVDHVLQKIPAVEATCTKTGLSEGEKCANCGEVTKAQQVVPVKDHTWSSWKTVKEATCTGKGSREKTCTVCGEKVTEAIPANGHEWNSYYTIDREPTFTREGSRSKHCAVCGVSDPDSVQSIPKLKASWKRDSKGWWYDYGDGTYPAGKFETIDGRTFYFSTSGYMAMGWRQIGGKWYFFGENGAMRTGWQKIGVRWCYFNSKGVMQTGWQKIGGKWYYLGESGAMAIGWRQIGGKWYYFGESGAMLTGRQNIEGEWYYFGPGGVMATGWQEISGRRYYFTNSGAMAIGWRQIGGNWYHFNRSGAMQTGWQEIDDKWYYLGRNGVMVTGWKKLDGIWYYFSMGGTMRTGWQQIGGIWYYFNEDGEMQTGWQQLDGTWYYFGMGGAMRTGWQQIEEKWYYFTRSGAMQTGWQKLDGRWYYLGGGGAMRTGWQEFSGTWYYLSRSGAMVTGWQQIDGEWYYFKESGAMVSGKWIGDYYLTENGEMAKNAWIDGYYVGADGKWVPGSDAAG